MLIYVGCSNYILFQTMIFFKRIFLLFLFACPGYSIVRSQGVDTSAGKESIIADNARPVLISSQFGFTEGPAVDKKGNIYFTDQPNNKIWKYDVDGKLSVFMYSAGRSNGMYFDKRGYLVSCADEHNELWRISPDTTVQVLVRDYGGLAFNGPNDCWLDRKDGIYFTDPYYQRAYWSRTKGDLDGQHVYYLTKKKKLVVAADQMVRPNGIVGSADGKYLFVADIGADKTYRFRIKPDGSLTDKILFVSKGSDGMTIDNKGNIYLTGKGVSVYTPTGILLQHIDIPEPWTANVCFGGRNRDILFITASKSIYTLKMQVKGVEGKN